MTGTDLLSAPVTSSAWRIAATPASKYQALRRATPTKSNLDDHYRVRHDTVGDTGTLRHAGKLHHIGIGRTHARTHITMLIKELGIHIIATETGEVLRHPTLNPNRNYQPNNTTAERLGFEPTVPRKGLNSFQI